MSLEGRGQTVWLDDWGRVKRNVFNAYIGCDCLQRHLRLSTTSVRWLLSSEERPSAPRNVCSCARTSGWVESSLREDHETTSIAKFYSDSWTPNVWCSTLGKEGNSRVKRPFSMNAMTGVSQFIHLQRSTTANLVCLVKTERTTWASPPRPTNARARIYTIQMTLVNKNGRPIGAYCIDFRCGKRPAPAVNVTETAYVGAPPV